MIATCSSCSGQDWTAIAAGVIALCALAVSIWQGHLARQHNRLSFRPLLEIWCDATRTKLHLNIKNCGTGPALIRSTAIFYGGAKYNLSERADFERLLDVWKAEGAPPAEYYASFPDGNAVVAVNDSFDLFRVVDSPDLEAASAFFSKVFRNMRVEIRYQCIYKTDYTLSFKQATIAHD